MLFSIFSCTSEKVENKEIDLIQCQFVSFSKTNLIYTLILNLDNESKIEKIDAFKNKNPESSYFEYNENLLGIKLVLILEFIIRNDSIFYSSKEISKICDLFSRTPDIRKGEEKLNFSIEDFSQIKNKMLFIVLCNKNYDKLLLEEINKFKMSANFKTRKYLDIENEIYK